jgi:hypothetical protein
MLGDSVRGNSRFARAVRKEARFASGLLSKPPKIGGVGSPMMSISNTTLDLVHLHRILWHLGRPIRALCSRIRWPFGLSRMLCLRRSPVRFRMRLLRKHSLVGVLLRSMIGKMSISRLLFLPALHWRAISRLVNHHLWTHRRVAIQYLPRLALWRMRHKIFRT